MTEEVPVEVNPTVKPEEPEPEVDPVSASFIDIANVLDFFSRSLPGVGGPRVQETIHKMRARWLPEATPIEGE